jgi:hypothetical protein
MDKEVPERHLSELCQQAMAEAQSAVEQAPRRAVGRGQRMAVG